MIDWILHGTIAVGDGHLYDREVLGFAVWWRASRITSPTPELEGAVA